LSWRPISTVHPFWEGTDRSRPRRFPRGGHRRAGRARVSLVARAADSLELWCRCGAARTKG